MRILKLGVRGRQNYDGLPLITVQVFSFLIWRQMNWSSLIKMALIATVSMIFGTIFQWHLMQRKPGVLHGSRGGDMMNRFLLVNVALAGLNELASLDLLEHHLQVVVKFWNFQFFKLDGWRVKWELHCERKL
jgi:hypothetical protein